IGIVQVGGQSMADRYTYIPSIGFFLIMICGAADVLSRTPRGKVLAGATAALTLGVCTVLTSIQLGYWKNSETLFTHALAVTEESFMAHFCLANALIDGGKVDEGLVHLKRTAEIHPSFPNVYGKLGYVAAGQGKFAEAIEEYRQALKYRPDFPEALNNLAWVLATCPDGSLRNGAEAVAAGERACEVTHYRKALFVGTLAAAS